MDYHIAFMKPRPERLNRAGLLLGFSLGGFFDGILLHQILQWHHLLSGIGRAPFNELRTQILADGLFHALMYVIAAIGLWQLLRARGGLVTALSGRLLAAALLIGFGAWHVIDSILSHWILGIHRIRMDSPNPLAWDMLWFTLFGVLFIVAGIVLRRRPPSAPLQGKGAKVRSSYVPMLAGTVLAAALLSASGGRTDSVTVLLRPGATPVQLLAGLAETDARVVWNSPRGDVWVLALGPNGKPMDLYAHGAMLVSGTLLPAGCSAWVRA